MPSTDAKNIISFSKPKFQVACGITGVILIALLFWVYELSKKATGLPSELAQALADEPVVVPLINRKGGVRYFNGKGKELTPCASIDGTKVVPIEEGCGPVGEITNLSSVKWIKSKGSPDCEWVTDDNGKKLYKIHASGEFEGESKCHETGAHAP